MRICRSQGIGSNWPRLLGLSDFGASIWCMDANSLPQYSLLQIWHVELKEENYLVMAWRLLLFTFSCFIQYSSLKASKSNSITFLQKTYGVHQRSCIRRCGHIRSWTMCLTRLKVNVIIIRYMGLIWVLFSVCYLTLCGFASWIYGHPQMYLKKQGRIPWIFVTTLN